MPVTGGDGGPVVASGGGAGDALVGEVLLHAGEALGVRICGEQRALVVDLRCDEGGFATRGGAGIEYGLARLRREDVDGVLRGGVGDVYETTIEPILWRKSAAAVVASVAFEGLGGGSDGGILFGFEGVDAECGVGGELVDGHNVGSGGCAVCLREGIDDPIGMGVANGEGKLGNGRFECFLLADGAAENGIDEAASAFSDRFDCGVDGGVLGELDDENLQNADA